MVVSWSFACSSSSCNRLMSATRKVTPNLAGTHRAHRAVIKDPHVVGRLKIASHYDLQGACAATVSKSDGLSVSTQYRGRCVTPYRHERRLEPKERPRGTMSVPGGTR